MKLLDLFEVRPVGLKVLLNESTHISHPEDLIFDQGMDGAKRAVEELAELEKKSETITIKWDGYPALIFGRDAKGRLIISDKHMFNKIDKTTGNRIGLSSSSEEFLDYDKNRGADRNDLYVKEQTLRPALEKIIPNNLANRNKFYWGDLLWAGQLIPENGVFTFTPNTVTYKVREDSDIGKKIANSQGGIAVHSFMPGVDKPDEPLKGIGNLPENGPIVFLSGEMKEKPSVVVDKDLINRARAVVIKHSPEADKFIKMVIGAKAKSIISAMKTFITFKIKEGNFNNLAQDFLKYLPDKLTSDSARRNAATIFSTPAGKNGLAAIWTIWLAVTNLKLAIKKQIDAKQNDPNIPVRAFTGDSEGHEGYVVGAGENKLKLVNRLEFSKANFEKTRTDPAELSKRTAMPMAAFCFGRFNPLTLGHKLLMDTTASVGGNNTFIFFSSKHDPRTDPLDYHTKIAFAKKMFPDHVNQIVMDPILNPIYAANYLYKKGFRNITFVAGEDRLSNSPNSLEKALKNWNSGEIRSNDNTISNREEVILNFVSSGKRDPDSEGVDGYSATKAREAAADNDNYEFNRFTGANDNIKVNNQTLFSAVRKGMNIRSLNERANTIHSNGTIAIIKPTEECANKIKEWCDKRDIPCLDSDDLHCTILYSKKPVSKLIQLNGEPIDVSAKIVGWKKLGTALVFELHAPKAEKFHDWMISKGGTHDYPSFIAHVTVSYDWESDETPKKIPTMPIEFDRLEVKPIDTDYVDNITDDS